MAVNSRGSPVWLPRLQPSVATYICKYANGKLDAWLGFGRMHRRVGWALQRATDRAWRFLNPRQRVWDISLWLQDTVGESPLRLASHWYLCYDVERNPRERVSGSSLRIDPQASWQDCIPARRASQRPLV